MTCQTCGNPHQENFCPNCGEKRYDPHSLSLKHVLEESIESFTHADHNLLRTVHAVLLRPGQLPAEYVAGRRVRYMKPLGFFLVVNLVFFLLTSMNAFNQPLSSFLNYTTYTQFGTQKTIEHVLAEHHETLAEYTPRFNAAMTSSSKGFLVLLIPLYALVFSLLFIRTQRTFIEHLIFATYFLAFMLLFVAAGDVARCAAFHSTAWRSGMGTLRRWPGIAYHHVDVSHLPVLGVSSVLSNGYTTLIGSSGAK